MNDNPQYKAIETIHSGYKFRSRLEARWAVFFETLGIEYRYEPEGFDLDGTWYLPDFYLPQKKIWIEIKPSLPTPVEREKALQLCLSTRQNVVIFAGDVWTNVKGLGFAVYPSEGSSPITEDIVSSTFPNAFIHWLSTDEFIIAQSSDMVWGMNISRNLCWGTAFWGQCPDCGNIHIAITGLGACPCDCIHTNKNTPSIVAAFEASRQARF